MFYKRLAARLLQTMVVFALLLSNVSCSDDDDNGGDSGKQNFIEILKKDYQEIVSENPSYEGGFYEAVYKLNGLVSETPLNELKPEKVTYTLSYADTEHGLTNMLYATHDFLTDAPMEKVYESSSSPYFGDTHITSFDGFISVEEALKIAVDAGWGEYLDTEYITLRHPVVPNGSPRYMFGASEKHSSLHVQVEAKTGKIIVTIDSEDDGEENNITILRKDYLETVIQNPQLYDHFYEARYTLNGIVSDTPLEDLHAEDVTYVFARAYMERKMTDVTYAYRNFSTTEPLQYSTESFNDVWAGDTYIKSFDNFISLDDALRIVKEDSNWGDSLQTRFVTLRHPVLPMGSPRYIFGGSPGRSTHIHVDARTGAIYVYDDGNKDDEEE